MNSEGWPRPDALTVVGLDLAWSPRNPTGACAAKWDGRTAKTVGPVRADLGSNGDIVSYVRSAVGNGPAVVAIDCPLAVPNDEGLRDCDVLVNRFFRSYEAGVYPANRGNLGRYGGLRGVDLAAALSAEGFSLDPRSWARRRVIEVYPHAAMIALFGLRRTLKYKPRQGRTYEERWRELATLQRHLGGLRRHTPSLKVDSGILREPPRGLRGTALKNLEDRLDAIVCAYVGLAYGVEGSRLCAVFGDRSRGHVVIPMTKQQFEAVGDVVSKDLLFHG